MSVLEAGVSVVMGVKYLYDVAKKLWDRRKEKKEIGENEPRIERLMNEVEALKRQLEDKGREEVGDEDVSLYRQQLAEAKHLEGVIKEDVTSDKAFYTWLGGEVENQEMDVEEVAELYKLRLAAFINEARREGMSKFRLAKYKELKNLIEVNRQWVREAREKVLEFGGVLEKDEKKRAELKLWYCVEKAADKLKEW